MMALLRRHGPLVAGVIAVLPGTVFLGAAVSKAYDPAPLLDDLARFLDHLGFRTSNRPIALARVLVAVEGSTGLLLFSPHWRRVGLLSAAALLLCFTSYLLVTLVVEGPGATCACYPLAGLASVLFGLFRNVVLGALALVALRLGRTQAQHD